MITYGTLTKDAIGAVRPLWEALNRLHLERSSAFKENFLANTFDRRIEKFLRLPDDRLFVGTAQDSGVPVGYVVATLGDDGTGEIDSIFIDDNYRRSGVGRALMERSLAWLSDKGCATVTVAVAEGNQEAFGFYQRFGFSERMTILVRDGTRRPGGR